jgi:hypothetical protein
MLAPAQVIKFLGYEKGREIDESSKNVKDFDTNTSMVAGENVPFAFASLIVWVGCRHSGRENDFAN